VVSTTIFYFYVDIGYGYVVSTTIFYLYADIGYDTQDVGRTCRILEIISGLAILGIRIIWNVDWQ